ncbi:MAG: CoA transferase [Gammaproteobacteria bacterium]|nr:CoA transferase [Gammaproteobacteria bacterium]
MTNNFGPLAGITIIDLTSVVLGPYATQILGDYGAEVIKVEPPSGDIMRQVAPSKNPLMGHIFINANRNKRSVVLDLTSIQGRQKMYKMCQKADVLAFNMRPQAMAKMGLDWQTLHAINPKLIYCGAYGFSEDGPYAGLPAFDDIIQGACGIPWLMQKSGSPYPRYVPTTFADRVTALNMVHAIMAAIIARFRIGLGQKIEVPMFECLLQFVLGEHLAGKTWSPAIGEMGYRRLLDENRKPYKTLDGYLCLLIYNDKQWKNFVQFFSHTEELLLNPKFSTIEGRHRNADELFAFIQQTMLKKSTADWMKILSSRDIPVFPVMNLDDLLTDEHLLKTKAWVELQHPFEGTIVQFRPPIKMSHTPLSIRRPPPLLGEHNLEVFQEFGC